MYINCSSPPPLLPLSLVPSPKTTLTPTENLIFTKDSDEMPVQQLHSTIGLAAAV